MKTFVQIGGGFATGVMALSAFLVQDVLQIGVSTANRRSLHILVILKTVPLISAVAMAL